MMALAEPRKTLITLGACMALKLLGDTSYDMLERWVTGAKGVAS